MGALALSFGYAVGWGAFVMPGNVFLPGSGPLGTVAGILIGAAVMAVLALNYHRLVLRAPGPGGAYGFVAKVFGPDHGFLVAWFLCLTYVAILWANATALVLLARFVFGNALQFGFHYTMVGFDVYFGEVLLSVSAIVVCAAVCLCSKRLAAALNAFLAYAMLAGVLTCFAAALLRHEGGMASMAPAFAPDGSPTLEILRTLAMIPWAFVGFEAIVHSSGEFKFRGKLTLPILLAAIAISALLYSLLVLLPVLALPEGYSSWPAYIGHLQYLDGIQSVPVFSAATKVLGRAGMAVAGGSMLAGQLTALFATFIATSRLMRAMSLDGILPKRFAELNRDGNPANAILFIAGISLAVPFLGRTVIGWPVDVSSLGAAVAFCYVSAAAFAVARSSEKRKEPIARLAGLFGFVMSIVFCLLLIVPNYISGESLAAESYLLLAFWCIIGFLCYMHAFRKDSQSRFGRSTVVWVGVLIAIFFSSLMWFRLAICDSAREALMEFDGRGISSVNIEWLLENVSRDMLLNSFVELCILVASLAIMLNLFSIQRKRENALIIGKLKAEESASKSKSYFFSTVSHDIRTPLNAIIGYSEMMKMGMKTETERVQAVDSILISGRTLMKLINDVLDFSKLESGRMDIVPEPTDVAKLVDEIVESFRITGKKPAVELRTMVSGLPRLMLDPHRIGQFLFNLVGNAVKFTKEGFVEVRVAFTPGEGGESGTLRIEVEDTGCGISEEDVKRIALPYEQVQSKEARHGGTGLGLAICRQLAKAMGGNIAVKSVLGKGSTFTVTLPGIRICAAPPLESAAARPGVPAVAGGAADVPAQKGRILIVDDQKINLAVLKAMLKKLGDYDVVTAEDGKQALSVLKSDGGDPFGMVLTDMWMPEMDGEGLVRAMRADPRFANMPVHVVTADVEMLKKYDKAGFTGIFLKPVTVDKLRGIVS
ncbi:MAG: amino acid permease [Kiritimatiellae bacterium]|nr:amino acid permease [Kiritimatiellia bacterium]